MMTSNTTRHLPISDILTVFRNAGIEARVGTDAASGEEVVSYHRHGDWYHGGRVSDWRLDADDCYLTLSKPAEEALLYCLLLTPDSLLA